MGIPHGLKYRVQLSLGQECSPFVACGAFELGSCPLGI
jgi:hypothetical protein